ncbi:MAG: RNA-binding domain-containing protein [Candidatus Helarchaeota archaeon]
MKEPVKKIELEAFVQATEDVEKVIIAINNLVPPELRESDFSMDKVRGVFHNPITIVRISYIENTKEILEYIAQNLGEINRNYLSESIYRRIESGILYLRFEKQDLYQNKLQIKDKKDTIKVRISFSKTYASPENMIDLLREMEIINEELL